MKSTKKRSKNNYYIYKIAGNIDFKSNGVKFIMTFPVSTSTKFYADATISRIVQEQIQALKLRFCDTETARNLKFDTYFFIR